MKKKFLALALAATALTCSIGLTACNANNPENNNGLNEYTIETVYARAKALGYTGSLEEFIASISGKDGVGVLSAEVNENGNLIITLTNSQTIDCGQVTSCKHNYSDWSVVVASTCISFGYSIRTCENCHDEDYQMNAPISHTYSKSTASYDEHTMKCSYCKDAYNEAHEWENGECKICGERQIKLNYGLSSDETSYRITHSGNRVWSETLVIPETYEGKPVTIIGAYAFSDNTTYRNDIYYLCHSITLPASITTIQTNAFKDIDKIYYQGTIEQWNAIDKHSKWSNSITCDFTIVCTDGPIEVTDRGCSFWDLLEDEEE